MNIDAIENLTYAQAKGMAIEEIEIKGHECFFVDLGDAFGYSILVFKNGKHIYYANDYELHHHWMVEEKGKSALRDFYINEMNNKLFTDKELLEEVKSYDEYQRKDYFLRNYWIMRYDCVSAFFIGDKQEKELEKKKKNFPYYNPVCFCYVNDESIVNDAVNYSLHLKEAYRNLKADNDTFLEMIRSELYNHEACITCTAEDALAALGLSYLDLTDEQKHIVNQELDKQIAEYGSDEVR